MKKIWEATGLTAMGVLALGLCAVGVNGLKASAESAEVTQKTRWR